MINRRNFPRHSLEWPVFFRSPESSERIGELVNISLQGLQIQLDQGLDSLEMTRSFDLFIGHPHKSADLLEIQGTVVWEMEQEDSGIIGLRLNNLLAEESEMLGEFIRSKEDLSIQIDLCP
jgi:hypothetical protein